MQNVNFLIQRTESLAVRKQSDGPDGWVGRRDLPVGQIDATGRLEPRVLSCRSATTKCLVHQTGRRETCRSGKSSVSCCTERSKATRRLQTCERNSTFGRRLVSCRSDGTKELDFSGARNTSRSDWAKLLTFGRDPRASPHRQNAREIRSKTTTVPRP